MIGTKIENYRITSVLGEGGMGIVYKAFDLKLERYVAIKILSQKAVTNPQFVERFKREAKNQAQLSHPNIVPVYGFTDDQNLLGFVMEYVNGETLEYRIDKIGRFHIFDALQVMKQVLAGAVYAHSKGFIHRDLKPSNIIFTQEGIAKIMDFGISKSIYDNKGVTKQGVKVGTLLYMSPEQIKAYEPTRQSDLYALGIIFYEMLVGKNPFDSNSDFQIMEAHLKKYPPKLGSILPDVPEEVDKIIFKALAKSLDKRYQTAQEFYDDVDQEIVRLKSEHRKTKEFLLQKEIKKENSKKRFKYYFAGLGIVLALLLSYLAYDAYSGFQNRSSSYENTPGIVYQSNPYQFVNTNWRRVPSPVDESLTGVKITESGGVVCGFSGTLMYSGDSGDSWKKVSTGTDNNFYKLFQLDVNYFLIAGENGILLKFNLKDKSLTRIKTPVNESLFDIYFHTGMQTGYICGGKGTILKTTNGGESWFRLNTGTDKLLYSVYFRDEVNGYAVGWDGEFIRTINGGQSWEKMKNLTSNYLRNISFIDKASGFIVGGEGEVFKTSDSGNTWRKVESGISSGLFFVNFINPENGYILGSKGEILYSENTGDKWHVIQSGSFVPLTDITLSSDNSLFIVGYNGTILISR
jgi:eukaryotic-like serine/threonine-protein kinase